MPLQSVSIFGLGYVGSVMAACLAHRGKNVVGVDVSVPKVDAINSGHTPIIEERMEELVAASVAAGRLRATTNVEAAILQSDLSFVCVGTPSQPNGKLDLSHVEGVCREIGDALKQKTDNHVVVVRSTVLPGTTQSTVIPALEAASGKRAGVDFAVVYNPEFMREGSAVGDFFDPPYTVLGAGRAGELSTVRALYDWVQSPVFETSTKVAEMVKYVSNAFHAVKVCFANEMGVMAKRLGVDTEVVTEIFTSDSRLNISPVYLSPGFSFGGSCLPKDVRALTFSARESDVRMPLLESVMASNQAHMERAIEMALRAGKKKVALLGLSFKVGTDDLRESPQVELVKRLLGEGCSIKIWDPHVAMGRLAGANKQYIENVIPHIGSLLRPEMSEVVENAEVVIVGTREATKDLLDRCLRPGQIVIDLVNLKKDRRPGASSCYEGICW